MPQVKRPRRGSLAFYPRKRARRIYPKVDTFPKTEKVKPLAFAGYKVGMAHAIVVDTKKGSPTFGQEVSVPVTLLECPPLIVAGIRVYKETSKGLKVVTEVWAKNLPKEIERKTKVKGSEEKLKDVESKLDEKHSVRLIVATQPKKAIGKKKPEIFEIPLGGKGKEAFEYAKNLLGKEITVKEVFNEGELVDVIAVTKGKGTEGPVKRFGVKIQPRKAHEKLRHVGTLGQERPGKVRWTVPQAGQLGFQRRTEYNKRIIKIGEENINPKGGFIRYGIVKNQYVVLEGSVPGPKKRLVVLRAAIRPRKDLIEPKQIKEIVVGG